MTTNETTNNTMAPATEAVNTTSATPTAAKKTTKKTAAKKATSVKAATKKPEAKTATKKGVKTATKKATAKADTKKAAKKEAISISERDARKIKIVKEAGVLRGQRGKLQRLLKNGLTVGEYKEAADRAKVKNAAGHLRWAEAQGFIRIA
jgi:hypothetical protein